MWKIKAAIGLITLLVIAALVTWGKHGYRQRDQERAKVVLLVGVTAEVAMVPKLKVKDAPAAIRRIGSDRDTYYGNWQGAKTALQTQTDRVVDLGRKRDAAIAEADRARAQVAALKAQRDGWIKRAQAASTRTERRAAEAEVAECEASMDSLYKAGF
ncbi:MAG: hypothetical protein QOH04_1538 [Sphingomonadales bacterium]|jgi:hypothetical protein|nr:hypothetical protein [Sphingomonadales bacterium]